MKRLFPLFVAIIIFAACEHVTRNDFIEVSPSDELYFESGADERILTINSSGRWRVLEVPTWITVTPAEGKNGEKITVSVTENTDTEDRHATIVITCGSASTAITITQYHYIETGYNDIGLETEGTSYTYNSSTGTLAVTYQDTPPVVKNGDAIVLPASHGYDIRIIESASVSGKTLSLETSQGNMADLFKNISFTLSTSPLTKTKSNGGERIITPSAVGYIDTDGVYHESYNVNTKGESFQNGDKLWSFHTDLNGATIAQGSAGRLYWETCSFDAGLNGVFTFDFGEKKINEIRSKGDINSFSYELNGTIDMDFLLHYHYETAHSEEEDEIIEKNIIRTVVFKFMVGTVPVNISVNTHLGKSIDFSAEGQIDATAGVKFGAEVNIGAKWTKDSGAEAIKEITPRMELHHPSFDVQASAEAKISYYPHIDIRLYKFIGPWIEPRPYLKETVEAGLHASADGKSHVGWKSEISAGLDLQLGLNLDFGIFDFTPWESPMYNTVKDRLLHEAPCRITLLSPENGTKVESGKTVSAEFLVESYSPLTGKYYPCPQALVNLDVDGGDLEMPILPCNASGKASAQWIPYDLGNGEGTKTKSSSEKTLTLTAEVVGAEGETIDKTSLAIVVDKARPTPGRWVDLGLPSGIKWAGWNVGASVPEEYGGYYAWGETSEKSVYDFYSYQHKVGSPKSQYIYIGDCISGTSYDVATVRWGGGARMPTLEEIKELDSNCELEGGYINGVKGVFVIGPNGNSIFIPFAGARYDSDHYRKDYNGYLWSGTRCEGNYNTYAYDFYCNESGIGYEDDWSRKSGLSVRPVSD